MSIPKPRLFDPACDPMPKFFTQLPDDIDEDGELSARPGPAGILRALLRLVRRAGSPDRSIVCTHGDIAKEAGVTGRTARTHLGRLDRLGYVSREELSPAGGQTARRTRFTVTYHLRPGLKLEADPLTISGSQSASTRKKSSASTRKKSSACMDSAPLFERARELISEVMQTEESSAIRAPLPVEVLRPIPTPEYLEYPEEEGMWVAMPGPYQIAEIEARELWGDLWRAWKSPKLCIGFYEHQQWYSFGAWKHAIRTAVKRGNVPHSIAYLETIAVDADTNGIPEDKPIQRSAIGPVAYVPTTRQASQPAYHVAEKPQAAPDDPVMRDLMRRLVRARGDSATAAVMTEIEEHTAAAGNEVRPRVPLESPPRPAGVLHPIPTPIPQYEHTVKVCPGQAISQKSDPGQCPPRDSNPERTD